MLYPNAHDGIKKLRTAEFIILISAIVSLIMSVIVMASSGAAKSGGLKEGTIATLAVLLAIVGVLALIAFIINLVGLSRASKDEESFKKALLFTLAGIVVSVLSSAFSKKAVLSGVFDVIGDFLSIVIFIMVVRGIISLAKKVGDDEMITKGNALLTKAVAVYVVAVVAGLIGTLLKKSPTAMTIAGILLLISAVLAIIVYITYLKYLGKAVRMLEK